MTDKEYESLVLAVLAVHVVSVLMSVVYLLYVAIEEALS